MTTAHQSADTSVRCDCCRYPAGERLVEHCGVKPVESGIFCSFCRETLAATRHTYESQGYGSGLDGAALEVMRTICFVGNALLDALIKHGGN